MNKAIIYFEANEQCLKRTGTECFASDTVSYIEADFNLGENWSGFDSVRAVWSNGWETVSTVLDSDGKAIVPTEVLTRRAKVRVNLVGSIANGNELTDRLTTFPIDALDITKKALIDGSETTPITPSQFEQFVANVKADADRAENARDDAETIKTDVEGLKADVVQLKSDTEQIKTDTESLVNGFDAKVTEALDDISEAKTDALDGISSAKTQAVDDVTAEANTQKSAITQLGTTQKDAIIDEGTRQIGLVTEEGTDQVEAVQNEGQTQVNTVRTEGGTQITNIEQRGADVLSRIPYFAPIIVDTAEGSIASFSDGADDYPMKSVVAEIVPIQEGTGDPSPTNVRPISGWSGVNVSHSGADQTNPTVYSIPFKDSQGNPITVYGGEIDVVSGEGKAWGIVDLGTLNWRTVVSAGRNCFYVTLPNGSILVNSTVTGNGKGVCEALKVVKKAYTSLTENEAIVGANFVNNTTPSMVVYCSAYTDASTFKAMLNGKRIAYELADPTPIYCEPTEIKSLKGNNNVWADTGDISVEYPADTKLYIDKKINAMI